MSCLGEYMSKSFHEVVPECISSTTWCSTTRLITSVPLLANEEMAQLVM